MVNFLAYGAIGLGLALAVLAYRLLAKEQELKDIYEIQKSASTLTASIAPISSVLPVCD